MPHFLDRYCSKLVKFLGVCANTAREYRKNQSGLPVIFYIQLKTTTILQGYPQEPQVRFPSVVFAFYDAA